ncbi:MAG: valine--tRNA ligase, partial [Rhodobacteraceae bacterium]|nr:valine--tRNA ligase [Paracoccaceae bacterium]
IPPPNVTGSLHMGHAFNNTLQDILVRWHRMQGHDTLWQPGQDHAGIATQMVVERELAKEGKRRTDFSREAFEALVWEQKRKSGGTIIGQLKRLGCSLDWSRNAFTMSGAPGAPEGEEGNFHDAVIRVFVELYNKGLIYRGKRLVNWDPHFETAISDLEVENVEVAGQMWHFKYPLAGGETYRYVERDADGAVVVDEIRDYISIATTRPETMLGDGAVAVHPDDERYAPIIGKLCEIPVGPQEHRRLIPIIADDYPDPAFGSGAVKITGAHDFNDHAVARRAGIPCYRLMDTRARMRADGASYAEAAAIAAAVARAERTLSEEEADSLNLVPEHLRGLDRLEARARVVEEITAEGLAVMTRADDPRLGGKPGDPEEVVPLIEARPMMQPFGDRSKVVIEPMLTDQWFVDAARIVGPALDAVREGRTRILPEQHEKVYYHWLENIEPWCISRQLWWGHRIPVWYDDEGNQYCAPDAAAARAMAPGRMLRQDEDVLDTWFSSGLWPIGTLGWPEDTPELRRYFPTNVLVTGFDIIFFWVARMMMMQLAVVGEVPFRDVYVHALVRDEKGKKMSKSLGNVLDPLDLIDEYGADAVRFTLASMAAMGRDLKLSKDRIAGYRNFATKLWNATRFAEMNGVWEGRGAALPPPEAPRATANRWILGETARAVSGTHEALEAFRFNDAAGGLYGFVWGTVCDWYVEFAKPLLADPEQADETRAVMAHVLETCLKLLHPFMPFVTEEIWQLTGARPSVLAHADWPDAGALPRDTGASAEMGRVIAVIEAIRSARAELRVPAGLQLSLLMVDRDEDMERAVSGNAALIARLARIEEMRPVRDLPKGAVTVAVEGGTFALPLADAIDLAAEASRLQKSLDRLEKDARGLEGRLSNPRFAAQAPAEVVEESREQLALLRDEAARLSAALVRLREAG